MIKQQKNYLVSDIRNGFKFSAHLVLFLLGAYTLSQVMQRTLRIDPLDQVDQTSAVAFALLLIWLIAAVAFGLLGVLVFKHKIDIFEAIKKFITVLILAISGVMTGSSFLGLKGTPFYFGLWTGDLGVHMGMAVDAYNNVLSNTGYPPLWPNVVADVTKIFDLNIYTDYKLINVLSIPIFCAINLWVFQNLFPRVAAELLALTTTFSFATYGWKSAGNLWSQLILLILIKNLYENWQLKIKPSGLQRVKIFLWGLFFGLATSLYFNRLWWIGLSIALALLGTNFVKANRIETQKMIIDFFLGAGLVLGPLFLGRQFEFSTKGFVFLNAIAIIIWIALAFQKKSLGVLPSIIVNLFSFLIVVFLVNFRVGDSFIYPELFGKVSPDFQLNSLTNLALIIVIFIAGCWFAVKANNVVIPYAMFLVANILSAYLMMLYYATKMYQTRLVELWPRADESIIQSWNILIAIFSIYGIKFLIMYLRDTQFLYVDLSVRRPLKILISSLLAMALLAFISQTLGDLLWSMYPREGNYTMYSYLEIPDWLVK